MRMENIYRGGLLCACLAVVGLSGNAMADDRAGGRTGGGAYIVGRSTDAIIGRAGGEATMVRRHRVGRSIDHARLVSRPIVARDAVISRGLSEQPVHEHLVEVQMVNTTIYIDPDATYSSLGNGGLDADHSIVRAQRLYKALHTASSAYIVRSPMAEQAVSVKGITPRAIMHMPIPRPFEDQQTPRPDESDEPKIARNL